MIKGGGGALTREKIVAACSKKFVCIADDSKLVDVLGNFPLPVEVIPMARSYVARELVKLGGQPRCARASPPTTATSFSTCTACRSSNPVELETAINQIVGVVTNGLFARRAGGRAAARHRRRRQDPDGVIASGNKTVIIGAYT